jgi:hypothetical protein
MDLCCFRHVNKSVLLSRRQVKGRLHIFTLDKTQQHDIKHKLP